MLSPRAEGPSVSSPARQKCEKIGFVARVIRDCRKTRLVHVRTGYQARPAL
jgi:hypothetical protein